MIEAILLDLDDTLLGNDMNTFMHHYFGLLSRHAGAMMDSQQFISELLICTRAMIANTDTAVTNRDAFWAAFAERNRMYDVAGLETYFEQFYRDTFPQLREQTQLRPNAARLVQHCLDQGLQVVVATNPVFPPIAIEHRLAWAGLPVDAYPFALVTNYSNMHATKPHPAYYQEILQKIGCKPESSLMVGDSWENDMVPAVGVGLSTYWIAGEDEMVPDTAVSINAQGSLDKLYEMVQAGWLQTL